MANGEARTPILGDDVNEHNRPIGGWGVAYRTSIFIDFWNFSLQWRNRAHGDLIDWRKVPAELLGESERQLQLAGFGDALHLEEALVYASYDEDDPAGS